MCSPKRKRIPEKMQEKYPPKRRIKMTTKERLFEHYTESKTNMQGKKQQGKPAA